MCVDAKRKAKVHVRDPKQKRVEGRAHSKFISEYIARKTWSESPSVPITLLVLLLLLVATSTILWSWSSAFPAAPVAQAHWQTFKFPDGLVVPRGSGRRAYRGARGVVRGGGERAALSSSRMTCFTALAVTRTPRATSAAGRSCWAVWRARPSTRTWAEEQRCVPMWGAPAWAMVCVGARAAYRHGGCTTARLWGEVHVQEQEQCPMRSLLLKPPASPHSWNCHAREYVRPGC